MVRDRGLVDEQMSRLKALEGGYEEGSGRSERNQVGHNWVIQGVPARLSRAWQVRQAMGRLAEDWRVGGWEGRTDEGRTRWNGREIHGLDVK